MRSFGTAASSTKVSCTWLIKCCANPHPPSPPPSAELKPWLFENTNASGATANDTAPFPYPVNYNRSGSSSSLTTTTPNPLTSSIYYYNGTRISNNKKQAKSGNTLTVGFGSSGFQDQNAIRRGFNGTEAMAANNNNGGRSKEGGRQKNNRKQISNGGAGLNFDETGQQQRGGGGGAGNEVTGDWGERDSANYTEPKYYLGKLIQGTYCSRVFSDCEKRACRMQSPNFPGVYPRNLTCFYAVRQVSERRALQWARSS